MLLRQISLVFFVYIFIFTTSNSFCYVWHDGSSFVHDLCSYELITNKSIKNYD